MANPELTGKPSRFDEKAKAAARAATPSSGQRNSASRTLARGLGWFSLGLGLLELLATRPLARGVGLQGREALLRAYGLREIVSGVGLLASTSPAATSAWMWTRVAGDALDLVTLSGAALQPEPRRAHPMVAVAAVAGVAALDVVCARALEQEAHATKQTTDYSSRAGIPQSPDNMRGAALASFKQPSDMRVSPAALPRTMH